MNTIHRIGNALFAQVFDGGGLQEGIGHAEQIEGLANVGIREVVLNILLAVLNFLALAAVIAIIVGGFYLVLGGGTETSRDKAKNIIIYVIVGLIVIFFARVIVAFFLNLGNS